MKKPLDVSITLTVSRVTKCPFAVRSGGHSLTPGASSLQDGITIDMRALNSIDVSSDRKLTSVGPGATWGDVTTKLDSMGLIVLGGRDGGVGVGGLTLGGKPSGEIHKHMSGRGELRDGDTGGISYFSGSKGFACDNVANYQVRKTSSLLNAIGFHSRALMIGSLAQVILADARVVDINIHSYPDLYWALRGGGSNFGIVTRFDFDTYEQGQMWGGFRVYPFAAKDILTQGLENYCNNASTDPELAVVTSYTLSGGIYTATAIVDYIKPEVPAIFTSSFVGLDAFTPFLDTTRITTHSGLVKEFDALTPSGLRHHFLTATYKPSAALQRRIIDIFVTELDKVRNSISNTTGLSCYVSFQPITVPVIQQFAKNGGNPLGISPNEGPLMSKFFSPLPFSLPRLFYQASLHSPHSFLWQSCILFLIASLYIPSLPFCPQPPAPQLTLPAQLSNLPGPGPAPRTTLSSPAPSAPPWKNPRPPPSKWV
jgi:hypothetical protein